VSDTPAWHFALGHSISQTPPTPHRVQAGGHGPFHAPSALPSMASAPLSVAPGLPLVPELCPPSTASEPNGVHMLSATATHAVRPTASRARELPIRRMIAEKVAASRVRGPTRVARVTLISGARSRACPQFLGALRTRAGYYLTARGSATESAAEESCVDLGA